MFKKECIGFYPSDKDSGICAHYKEGGTCDFFWKFTDKGPLVCDDIIGANMNAHNTM